MKLFVILFFGCVVSVSALTRSELEAQIRRLNQQQAVELQQARQHVTEALGKVVVAEGQILQVATERDGFRAYGDDQHDKWINAERRVAEQKVAKLKWAGMFSGLLLLVLAFVGIKYFTPLGRFIP